jgi:AraC-like DNA-binding protein
MIEWNNLGLQPVDRFDSWCAHIGQDAIPMRMQTDVDDFRASATHLKMGCASFSLLEFSQLRSVRNWQLIRQSDPESWKIALIGHGAMRLEQHHGIGCPRIGNLMLFDTSHPFEANAYNQEDSNVVTMLEIPRHNVPLPDQNLRNFIARPISTASGAASVLARFLQSLAEQATTLQKTTIETLGSATVGIATTFLAQLIDADSTLPPHTRQQAMLYEIKGFIMRNLDKPQLSATSIAAAHHISVRYLHHLFQQDEHDGQTVMQFVRNRRLERCRTDLADPRLAGRSVAEIGIHWGFPDATGFGRAFKNAYGISPGEFRRHGTRTEHPSPQTVD